MCYGLEAVVSHRLLEVCRLVEVIHKSIVVATITWSEVASTHGVVGTLAKTRYDLNHTHQASIEVYHLELCVRSLDALNQVVERQASFCVVVVINYGTALALFVVVVGWEPATTVVPEDKDVVVCGTLLLAPLDEVGKHLGLVECYIRTHNLYRLVPHIARLTYDEALCALEHVVLLETCRELNLTCEVNAVASTSNQRLLNVENHSLVEVLTTAAIHHDGVGASVGSLLFGSNGDILGLGTRYDARHQKHKEKS